MANIDIRTAGKEVQTSKGQMILGVNANDLVVINPEKLVETTNAFSNIKSDIGELKSDLVDYKENVKLIKNLAYKYISGKRLNGSPTYEIDDPNYGYVAIHVEPNKKYTLSNFGSNNFSRVCKADGTYINGASVYRTSDDGYVFEMPDEASILYTCANGWGNNNDPKIVAFEGNNNITNKGITTDDFPYNTIARVYISKLYSEEHGGFIDDLFDRSINISKVITDTIVDIRDDKGWTGASAGSSRVVENENGTFTFTRLSSSGGGAYSKIFTSNSESVNIEFKGSCTTGDVSLSLWYKDTSNNWINVGEIGNSTGNESFNIKVSFDSAYYAVYKNAVAFQLQLTSGGTQSAGDTVTFSCLVYEPTELQKQKFYGNNLTDMLISIGNEIDSNSHSDDTVRESKVTSPNGNKYVLSANDDGTLKAINVIPNKVLFVGNSLLLGMGSYTDLSKGVFGMCATNSQSDYYYFVKQAILRKNPNCQFSRCHGAQFEQLGTSDSFTTLWNTTENTYTHSPMKESFTNDLDLIILQISDNANTNDRSQAFKNNINDLISNIKSKSPNARIVWVDGWFNAKYTHDTIIEYCKKWCIPNVYISDLNTVSNQQTKGATITFDDGSTITAPDNYITHPGNNGFELIAERIINVLDM